MEGNIEKERDVSKPELCVFASISIGERTQHFHNCVQRKLHLNKVILQYYLVTHCTAV
jgi:hypothetical protein